MSEDITAKEIMVEKPSFPFSNKKGTLKTELHLKLNKNGIWDAYTTGEFLFMDREEKEGFDSHKIEFIRPWWRLSVQVDNLSSDVNEIGMKIANLSKSIDNVLKYYMKELSIFKISLEKDLDGFEKISDKCWEKMTAQDGLSPQIIACLYRSYKEISDI